MVRELRGEARAWLEGYEERSQEWLEGYEKGSRGMVREL